MLFRSIGSEEFDQLTAYSCHLPRREHSKITHSVLVESFEHGWGIVSRLSDEVQVMSLFSRQRVGDRHCDVVDHLNDGVRIGPRLRTYSYVFDYSDSRLQFQLPVINHVFQAKFSFRLH